MNVVVISPEELARIVYEASSRAVTDALARSGAAEWLTLDAVASLLAVDAKTIRRYVRDFGLPGRRLGREWRFRRDDVEAWLDARTAVSGAHARKHARRLRAVRGGKE